MNDFVLWAAGVVASGVFGLIGWAWNQHSKDIKMLLDHIDKNIQKHDNLETRFDAHRLYAAETFATKLDVEKGFDRVMQGIEKIDNKLDRKVDK